MRAIILVLIIAVVAIIAAVGTGFIDINQIRGAQAPDGPRHSNGVVAHRAGRLQRSMSRPAR